MALLKSIKNSTKVIKFKLPVEVVNDFQNAVDTAKQAGLRLDITDQIEKIVAAATRQAQEELESATAG